MGSSWAWGATVLTVESLLMSAVTFGPSTSISPSTPCRIGGVPTTHTITFFANPTLI
ncbi:hypothetical protein X975_11939, partial [Stegodyphus mimosarum]